MKQTTGGKIEIKKSLEGNDVEDEESLKFYSRKFVNIIPEH